MSETPKSFSFPTDAELEQMSPWLSEESYKTLRKKIKDLRQSKPDGFEMNLQYLDPEFNSVEAANEYLQTVMRHLHYHRQLSFIIDLLRVEVDKRNRILKKEKSGAPKGHEGKTRSIPDHIDKTEQIAPPHICPMV